MLQAIQENLFFITLSANTLEFIHADCHLLNAGIAYCNPIPLVAGEGWMA
jgi:hypothetical protein